MNINSTCLHELGSVLKPLIMALGLDVGKGKVSMTGTYDVTNKIEMNKWRQFNEYTFYMFT